MVHFVYSFSVSWMLALYINIFITICKKMIIKIKSLQIVICSLLQTKHLVITQQEDDGVKIFLSYLLQQLFFVSVELHGNFFISFVIG